VDTANSVDTQIGQYRATPEFRGSVETLRGGAEMPKRKSGQQVPSVRDGQGNLMLDAKQRVECSNHSGDANFLKKEEKYAV